jgi:hypothetical protein
MDELVDLHGRGQLDPLISDSWMTLRIAGGGRVRAAKVGLVECRPSRARWVHELWRLHPGWFAG